MKNFKQFGIGFLILTFLYLLMNGISSPQVSVVEQKDVVEGASPQIAEAVHARQSQAGEAPTAADDVELEQQEPTADSLAEQTTQNKGEEVSAAKGLIQDLITELEWVPFENKTVDSHDHGHEEGARREVIAFAMKSAVLVKEAKVRTLKVEELQLVQNFYEDCSLGRGTFQSSPSAIKVLCLTNLEEISFRYPEVRKTLENALQQSTEGTRQIYEFLRPHQSRGT